MQKTIDVSELQDRLRVVLDEVVHGRVSYVVARGSDPEVVVISYDQFLRYRELDEQGVSALFDRMHVHLDQMNAEYSEEAVAADVAAAIAEVRAENQR